MSQCVVSMAIIATLYFLFVTRITLAVKLFSDHVILNDNQTNITLVRENIIFQVIDMRGQQTVYGLSVSNLTWVDQSSNDVDNVFVNMKQYTASPWESAILFSDEVLSIGSNTTGSLFSFFIVI